MARPRFLFVSGPSGLGFGSSGRPWYSWRLVGANNRPLASSRTTFLSLMECRQSVETLQGSAVEGTIGLVADVTNGLWCWRYDVGGDTVAVSARSYQRQRECRYSADAFLAAVTLAVCSAELIMLPRGRERSGLPVKEDEDGLGARRVLSRR